ncbi:MAG: GNAT family N-acetyltransferase [Salinibacterium sp.]|nr:GNAT family N-acetyltransferase [Salinibacterium sp.]
MATVRRATPADWRGYRALRLRSLELAPDAFGSTLEAELAQPDEWWAARLAGSHTLLAEVSGAAVGIGTGIRDRHEIGSREIVGLWVEPEFRGRGLASELIEHLSTWAQDAAAHAVALWVSDGNDAARRLYERSGFVATGEREVVRGTLMEERMRRPLDPVTPHETPGWRSAGIVFDGEAIDLDGVNPWQHSWNDTGEIVWMRHPSYPTQLHDMPEYMITVDGREVTFAAGELSNTVWGFFLKV